MGELPKIPTSKTSLGILYSTWISLSRLAQVFSIFAAVSATGALYNVGFFRKVGLSGEAIVDPSSLSQGALFASLSAGFLIVVLRFHFVASSYALKNILAMKPRRSRAEWQRLISDYDRMLTSLPALSLPPGTKAAHESELRATRKKLARQKWFFYTLQVSITVSFFVIFTGFAAYLMRPFLSIGATAALFVKIIVAYVLVIFSLTVLSFKGDKVHRWRSRFATLFFRPDLVLLSKGGIVGACYLYAALMTGIGEARYFTLTRLPDVCVVSGEKIIKGKLITKNSDSYIFVSASYPTFHRLVEGSGKAVIPLEKVTLMTTGLPCVE